MGLPSARSISSLFGAEFDTFGGSSGAPVFDAEGMLLGIAVAGLRDYEFLEASGCFVQTS